MGFLLEIAATVPMVLQRLKTLHIKMQREAFFFPTLARQMEFALDVRLIEWETVIIRNSFPKYLNYL